MSKPKIAVFDIETFPNLVYTWGLFKQNIGVPQIVRDWSLASLTWKWLGEEEIVYVDCSENVDDDEPVLSEAWRMMNEADIIVGQNSVHFDTRKLMARFIEKGYEPPSPFKQIDTKVEASKVAMFTSNRLEWLSAHLSDVPKDKHKDFPGFELWSECLKGNPKAWAAMREYNPRDVIATEQVYLKLRPYIKGHPNLAVYRKDEKMRCGHCGSTHVQKRGKEYTNVGEYHRYKCTSCGAWSRSGYTINSLSKRKSLLRT
jgi:hypothetical protein